MPLSPGNSRGIISRNISEMVHSGYPQRQAVAASLSNARRHPHRDSGGALPPDYPDRSNDPFPAPGDPRVGSTTDTSHPVRDSGGISGLSGYLGQIYQGLGRSAPTPKPPSRAYGGGMGVADPSSGGILSGSANPMMQGQMQQLAQLPDEKLQELAIRMPNNPLVSRALAQRHMHAGAATPAGSGILPSTPQAQQGSGILPQQQRRGGTIAHRDAGGSMLGMPLGEASPWWERSQERGMEDGYLHGSTFGRADHLTTTAPGGSYVVPADVISGVGEGNSPAGAAAVEHMLTTGPWGTPLRGGHRGSGPPRPPRGVSAYRGQGEAKGGGVQSGEQGVGQPVPVKLSHGEYVISPQRVLMIGRYLLRKHGGKGVNETLAMKLGHDALDEWVKHERTRIVTKMKNLPGPTRATGGRLAAA